MTAQLEKAKFLLSSRRQTGLHSPPISGPRPLLLARSRRVSRSPASTGPISARTLSGSCADAVRVDRELGGSCGNASVLLVAGEDLCGAVGAPRRCLGPTRCSRNICGAWNIDGACCWFACPPKPVGPPRPCLFRSLPSCEIWLLAAGVGWRYEYERD